MHKSFSCFILLDIKDRFILQLFCNATVLASLAHAVSFFCIHFDVVRYNTFRPILFHARSAFSVAVREPGQPTDNRALLSLLTDAFDRKI